MTDRVISLVTPVHPPAAQFLADAYASILAQDLPDGWDWQWVIQEDGHSAAVLAAIPDDHRISFGTGRAGGPAVARTLSLSRVAGEIVQVLDADDQLTPGALARVIDVFTNHADVGWTTTRVVDLLPDGTTQGFDFDPPPGRLTHGSVLAHWQSHSYRASVHPATLAVRRDLLLELGGWMALPASEDTGLLLALDATVDGCFIPEAGLLYRKWPGQMTAQSDHIDTDEREARFRVIEQRALAIAHRRRGAVTSPA